VNELIPLYSKKLILRGLKLFLNLKNRLFLSKRNRELFIAATELVTPFTGFMLSDWFLSSEIEFEGLRWLNYKSRKLSERRAGKIHSGQIVYCQVDQIEIFSKKILPKINSNFILITGKWHLPGLTLSDSVKKILSSPFLISWHSQNQIISGLPIRTFPYGISIQAVTSVYRKVQLPGQVDKKETLIIPFASLHNHLEGSAKTDREQLSSLMSSPLPLEDYLSTLETAKFVSCPAGDRPDTYRHWETIALGGVPVTNIPIGLEALFQKCIINISPLCEVINLELDTYNFNPRPELATVSFWRNEIRNGNE